MTVKEFYDLCGGGYEEMAAKFPSDALILKFLKMFEKDTSFDDLCTKLEADDAEGAFSAVHNLKGLVLNLNLRGMIDPVNIVTEALRAKQIGVAKAALPKLKGAYDIVKNYLLTL